MSTQAPVLLCMDLQAEFAAPGRPFADPDGEVVGAHCAQLIEAVRIRGWTVIHALGHAGSAIMPVGGLQATLPGCGPNAGDVVLRRAGVSAFSHPDLDDLLESGASGGVYMIGFSAPISLTSTLFDALDRRRPIYLVEDAIGAADIGDWSADHTRALCIDTARRMERAVRIAELPGFGRPRRSAERA